MGLPGARIGYHGNQVPVNGQVLAYESSGASEGKDNGTEMSGAEELREQLPGRPHRVLERSDLPFLDQGEGAWEVPAGRHFRAGGHSEKRGRRRRRRST